MSSRAGGGAGNASSAARKPLAEDGDKTEDNLDDDLAEVEQEECDICSVCDVVVEENQDGLYCEGCLTWFHRRCLKITTQKYKQLQVSRNAWYCGDCSPHQWLYTSEIKWGNLIGYQEISSKLNQVYKEITCWYKNFFKLPWGKVGKDFIVELCRIIELFTEKTAWKPVALKMFHVFVPIMLQKPSFRSTAKKNAEYLAKRMVKWKSGQIDELLQECRTIQKSLKVSFNKKAESNKKAFCRCMFKGEVSKALRFIDTESKITGVHTVDDSVLKMLEKKHPDGQKINEECVLEAVRKVPDPVFYEGIDGSLIQSIAKGMTGSGGPTKTDADIWKRILCSRTYGKLSDQICQSVAELAKQLCRENVDSSLLAEFVACRLVPLRKDDGEGIRPIGIGEIIRRIIAKAVGRLVKPYTIDATGSLQTCSGIDGGIEATIHSMAKKFEDDETEGILLVDAENAFNELNREVALSNVKALCPEYHQFLSNTYKSPSSLIVHGSDKIIQSKEGTTQGDPDAMDFYAIATRPIIDNMAVECANTTLVQCWYADDSAAGGTLSELKQWFDKLSAIGPAFGYKPKPSKCVIIVKDQEKMDRANELFKCYKGLTVTKDGLRHLGAVVGSDTFRENYVQEKCKAWVKDIEKLSEIAREEPQIALKA